MQYDKSFKEEALKLSDEIGVKAAAAQLGIPYYTLSGWRNNRKKYGADLYCGSGHKRMSADSVEQRIRELEKENTELKHAKGGTWFFRTTPKEIRAHQRYLFIFEKHHGKWTVKLMCRIFCVSVSGYY